MSLYVIADLHLSINENTGKSMEVFGPRWRDYVPKLEKRWRAVINPTDTVVIPGDISWAMTLEEALPDLRFIDSLPGRKILGKGNHDFWWSTATKMQNFLKQAELSTIDILYNNAFETEDFILCGSRGWFNDEAQQKTVGAVNPDYQKIIRREVIRLKMSLDAGVALAKSAPHAKEILVFLHFPPVFGGFLCREIVDLLREYQIKNCFYGHIHGNYFVPRTISFEGMDFVITSSDFLNFSPMPILPSQR